MEEPGLDNRNRDGDGQIRRKNGSTLNKNLPQPIPEFSPLAKLKTVRNETGEVSVASVRRAAKKLRPLP
jgi:hypothetical protein